MVSPRPAHCRRRHRLAEALLLALLVPTALANAQAPQDTAQQDALPLYLEVRLNQARSGLLLPFTMHDGRLSASVATLRQAGFSLPGRDAADTVALDAIPGVEYAYDATEQRVAIDAPLTALALETTLANATAEDIPRATRSTGLLLNYDLYASHDDSGQNASAFAELRLTTAAGVFTQTAVSRAFRRDQDPRDDWRGDSVRLDTQWRWSDPGSMLSVTAGDTISGGLGWTRPVRLGGVSIARDFSLQPYRVTTPLPAFVGDAAVPSSVELYVDGIRQYSGEVPVGPFQVNAMPGISGAGVAQMVVTDAYGATRSIDFPFYAARNLLADGLTDWSVDLGLVRDDYGLRSFAYHDEPVASAGLRHGASDSLTLEAHAEAGGGLTNAGGGAYWALGQFGVVNASAAHGRANGDAGWQVGLGYQWSNRSFNASIDSLRTHGEYRDIASLYDERPPSVSDRALLGWSHGVAGSFSLSYVRLAYPEQQSDARYASANWSRNLGRRWYLSVSANQNLDDSGDRSVFVGATYSFEARGTATASYQRNGDRRDLAIDMTRPVPGDGGHGWRAQLRHNDEGSTGLAELGWLGQAGRLDLGVARLASGDQAYGRASGGLVLMGGHLFASRYVDDAFAVVSTGLPDVPVQLENRAIGRTDANGMMLVTRLNAWQRNTLAIDPMSLPADVRLPDISEQVTPADRGGALVEFRMTRVRSALLVLRDAAGEPLPLGARVRLRGSDQTAIVGYDGETYVEGLDAVNVLDVASPAGTCHVRFEHPGVPGDIPRLGPLTCSTEEPR